MSETETESSTPVKKDWGRIVVGVLLLGSIWGLLECIVGGFEPSIGGIEISTGAVLAGFFALGFMALGKRNLSVTGVVIGMALVAGTFRFFAPIGSVVVCSAIAIVAEGVIFEFFMARKSFFLKGAGMKDIRTLAYLGVIMGYVIFVSGYVITLILTPLETGGTLNGADVVDALPLIFGKGFFAALLGGVSMPLAVLAPQLSLDISKVKKEFYYGGSVVVSALCWVTMIALFYYPGGY